MADHQLEKMNTMKIGTIVIDKIAANIRHWILVGEGENYSFWIAHNGEIIYDKKISREQLLDRGEGRIIRIIDHHE